MRDANRLAAALLHMRVLLGGSGAFRVEAGRSFGASCILPGTGFGVILRTGPGGEPLAHMLCPDGRAFCSSLDISRRGHFAALMHNADVETCRAPGRAHDRHVPAAEGGVPREAFDLADAAARSDDPAVAALALALPSDALDLPAPAPGRWRIPAAADALLDACLSSRDPSVSSAALALVDVDNGDRPGRPFGNRSSMLRWRAQADLWSMQDAGCAPGAVPTRGGTWVPLPTLISVRAEADRMGHEDADFLLPEQKAERRVPAGHARGAAPRRPASEDYPPLPEGEHAYWALRGDRGESIAVAVLGSPNQGIALAQAFGPPGNVRAPLREHPEALDDLMQASVPRPGPRF